VYQKSRLRQVLQSKISVLLYKLSDALKTRLDAAYDPKAKLQNQGKNPKNKSWHVLIAAGVFSETTDYTGATAIRLENFILTLTRGK